MERGWGFLRSPSAERQAEKLGVYERLDKLVGLFRCCWTAAMFFCSLQDHTELAGTIICGPEGYLYSKPPVYKNSDTHTHTFNYWLQFRQSLGVWWTACAWCAAHVHVYADGNSIHICCVCSRQSVSSRAAAGREVVMDLGPSRQFPESIEKKDAPSHSAEEGCPWHHSHSPTLSLTLLLCWLHAVPLSRLYPLVCMCVCFFHTCYGSPPNFAALSPCLVSSFLFFFFSRLPWLSLTEYSVILTCLLYAGAPNSTSGPPWITNAPTVGPQTAHCLTCAVFLGLSITVRVWVEAGSCLCVFTMYLQSLLFSVFILQTLPQVKLHLCDWHSREPPPQTAEQDTEPGNPLGICTAFAAELNSSCTAYRAVHCGTFVQKRQ